MGRPRRPPFPTLLPTLLWALALAAAAPSPRASAEPIATAGGETPGMHLQVQELRRDGGGGVTLRFTVVNDSDILFDRHSLGISEPTSVDGVYLLDIAGRKKYEVVRDAQRYCVCTRNIRDHLRPRASANFWAKFPAPPEGVTQLSVIIPRFMPLDNVPLGR